MTLENRGNSESYDLSRGSARIISVFSAKGGVGKTLIASNLAIALLKPYRDKIETRLQKRVLLIDLDLEAMGDVSRMLKINSPQLMVSLFENFNEATLKKDAMRLITSHESGIDFLPAVSNPREASSIDVEKLNLLINVLSTSYDYIVIDAGNAFNDVSVDILDKCNLILLVVTPDVLSLDETRWTLDTLQSLHIPLKMIKLILNRSESPGSLSRQEIKISVPSEILEYLSSEGKIIGNSLNRGIPVILDKPTAKFSTGIKKLAVTLDERGELYVYHRELGKLSPNEKKAAILKAGIFWQKQGLAQEVDVSEVATAEDALALLKQRIHRQLVNKVDLKRLDLTKLTDAGQVKKLREDTEKAISNLLAEESNTLIGSREERADLIKEITDEALGLGPLEDLLEDDSISEIMVNSKDKIYVEKNGKIHLSKKKFTSDNQLRSVIERIISPLGRRIDESVPMVDARLPDGSRVNAIISPLSLGGSMLTIRKFKGGMFSGKDLINLGTMDEAMDKFIHACVSARKNIIVSGGTGSGKTTFLNVLSSYLPKDERILTIEDAAELQLSQDHWGRLESRPPNIEGKGAVTVRDLFINALRMRPDRIIIGECRGPEVLDMLQAMNTGHDGSMTTIHANSTHDVIIRLDSMILMSGIELPVRSIREMISSAIDIVVHTARLSDGSRKVIQISEVAGLKDETHINLKDIFIFNQSGVNEEGNVLGNFEPTGYVPTFFEDMKKRGIKLSLDIFQK